MRWSSTRFATPILVDSQEQCPINSNLAHFAADFLKLNHMNTLDA